MGKDRLTKEGILSLSHHRFSLIVEREVTSTNTLMREMADRGAPAGLALVAQRQSAGRGRLGRTFSSPDGGLYLSLLLRPASSAKDALTVTTAAAVAVCRALSAFVDEELRIKWVNDVYFLGKKICGILTESVTARGKIDRLILGIGINLIQAEGGFPPELRDIAGALFAADPGDDVFNRVAARLLDELDRVLFSSEPGEVLEEYRRRSLLIGRDVTVTDGNRRYPARVTGISDEYALLLTKGEGEVVSLRSGEVSFSQWKGDKRISLSPED